MKKCSKCQIEKPKDQFSRNKSSKDGLDNYCKPCKVRQVIASSKRSPRKKEYAKEYYQKNIHLWKSRDTRPEVLKRYGLNKEQFEILLKNQNGVCAICQKPEVHLDNLSVDHDHRCCPNHKSCGKCIRGLLCTNCNRALGLFKEDILNLEAAIKYLRGNP